jgi:serine protease Do
LVYEETAIDPEGGSVLVRKAEGPSEKGGFRAGDQVVQVGDTKVRTALDFERSLLGLRAGDQAQVVVRRGQTEQSLSLTIEDMPRVAESPTELVWRRLGVRLSSIDPYQVQRFQPQLNGGMYIAQVLPGSPAASAGVRPGDLLLGLQKWETLNYENVVSLLTQRKLDSYDPIAVHVLRNGERQEFQLRLVHREARAENREFRSGREPRLFRLDNR